MDPVTVAKLILPILGGVFYYERRLTRIETLVEEIQKQVKTTNDLLMKEARV